MSVAVQEADKSGREVWLTAMLRPAGDLVGPAADRFAADLLELAARADIVIVNLVAASVPAPDAFAEALRRPGELLSGPDRCLLLVGADEALLRELRDRGGEVATLAEAAAA